MKMIWPPADPADPLPVPWADTAGLSFLATSDELRTLLEAAGFEVAAWNDLTAEAAQFLCTAVQFLHTVASSPASTPGLQVYVPDFPTRAANGRRPPPSLTCGVTFCAGLTPPRGEGGHILAQQGNE